MPTFGLNDDDFTGTYGGDKDMYFRQWRAPSNQKVYNDKLDRDFREAIEQKENLHARRAEKKKNHSAKFDAKMNGLIKSLELASVSKPVEKKPFIRDPTETEKKQFLDGINREFVAPSSTARMFQAKQLPQRPRMQPEFGNTMASQKNIVKPPSMFNMLQQKVEDPSTPKDHSFLNNSHDSVFYPQANNSFNLDNYNGTRPSFAFGAGGATSTPVSKHLPKFSIGSLINEETSFDETKYVTALESPTVSKSAELADQEKAERLQREAIEEQRKKGLENMRLAAIEEEKRRREAEKERLAKIAEEEQRIKEKQQKEEENRRIHLEENAKSIDENKVPPPYMLFEKLMSQIDKIVDLRKNYEKTADVKFRSLLKRTIIEKVTIFTQRETSTDARNEILQFFTDLLRKKSVKGFSLFDDQSEHVQLKNDDDVKYAVYCIVDKYIALSELDEDLATSISDLITRLSNVQFLVERYFIILILNRSTALRQNREECFVTFVDNKKKMTTDDFAIFWNREKALVALFLSVFSKTALFAMRKEKLMLNDEMLWKYADAVIETACDVPKAAFILVDLLTLCTPRLQLKKDKWSSFLTKLFEEVVPHLQEHGIPDDQSIIGNLSNLCNELKAQLSNY